MISDDSRGFLGDFRRFSVVCGGFSTSPAEWLSLPKKERESDVWGTSVVVGGRRVMIKRET